MTTVMRVACSHEDCEAVVLIGAKTMTRWLLNIQPNIDRRLKGWQFRPDRDLCPVHAEKQLS